MKNMVGKAVFNAMKKERDSARAELRRIQDAKEKAERERIKETALKEKTQKVADIVFRKATPERPNTEKGRCISKEKFGLTALGKIQGKNIGLRILMAQKKS